MTRSLTETDFERLREVRALAPHSVRDALRERSRRPLLPADGRLMISGPAFVTKDNAAQVAEFAANGTR